MTPAPLTAEALVDGDHDMPTDAEIQAMHEEADNFRLPAPPPTPVRGRFYLTECEHCGWVGSSEHLGVCDDDISCPVCCRSICGDAPDEADTAKHGEAVYQRIVAAEAALATANAELARLRAEGEDLREALKIFAAMSAMDPPKSVPLNEWLPAVTGARSILNDRTALARAATAREEQADA